MKSTSKRPTGDSPADKITNEKLEDLLDHRDYLIKQLEEARDSLYEKADEIDDVLSEHDDDDEGSNDHKIKWLRDCEWTRALLGITDIVLTPDKVLTPQEAAKWLENDRIQRARNVAEARPRRGPKHW